MLKNRSLSFEVTVCREGRWTIEAVFDDEAAALRTARGLLATGGAEEVKVTRQRSMFGGFSTNSAILHERRPEVRDKPIVLGARLNTAPACGTRADLYGLPSRQAMNRLFRQFLDKYRVTPTEVLHNWSWARRLADTGTLLSSASHHVASLQAEASGRPVRERLGEIEGLVAAAMARARDFAAERRRLPRFEPAELGHVSRRIRAEVGPEEHDFTFLAMLSLHLMQAGSIAGRQEMVLAMIADDLDPGLSALLEGVVADTLGTAEAVKELLGPQTSLGASLGALADFLNGRAQPAGPAPSPNTALARIGRLAAAGRADACRAVLLDRLVAELGRDNPLDKRNADAEAALLDRLVERLTDDAGALLGGAATEAALSRRRLRLRQSMLRGMGLVDAAEQLPSRWPPPGA
ncbi:hypothetical protein [Arenibaculum sp.]|uniref:hypothetical protein n=1 Tax=Arenibaculum sp. TaxID=2865862 RepID=UPI002E12F310|nr:hypothetical protein [Arenibaculum sp.]